MKRDYSPILEGEGDDDYSRYMRTGALLSLQRGPQEWIHRDELLFQVVHQSTELWLKLAGAEVTEADARIQAEELDAAAALLGRAALAVELVTDQLRMLRHLSPWDFQTIRPVLGNGSGFESPGWQGVRETSKRIGVSFDKLLAAGSVDLAELYRTGRDSALHRLAEALIAWDEQVAVWRTVHYKVATRIIGHDVVGTKGTEVDVLAKLIGHKFFPELWRVRTELTRSSPLPGEGES
jgi:tryptophan 2,3-dioxygenase